MFTMSRRSSVLLLFYFILIQFPIQFIVAFNNSHILQDVLKQISVKHRWDLQTVRVSRLDSGKVSFGSAQRYEFRIGLGKAHVVVLFSDDVTSWRKFRKPRTHFGSLIKELGSMAAVDTFKVEGPFELRVDSDHDLSLSLPMNTTYNRGVRRVLVGEGITVEVTRATEVSVFHASDLGSPVNGSATIDKEISWPFWHSYCAPLVPVRVFGPASLVAYRTRTPAAHIETKFVSKEIIELLPEKCFSSHRAYKKQKHSCPVDSLSLRISMLERIWKGFLGDRIRQKGLSGFLEGKIKASTIVRFKLQLERDFRRKGMLQRNISGWRTRPDVERVWFEVLARVESERLGLRPILVKKIRPFIIADSAEWGNPLNISFTKSQSILVAPEALTLDVKW
ncbi:uncharacterized protein LOC126785385 [Argentina anserina]|uniref:uncharacterized protein LOC126785385 n=1 Tax=Argentina anserina TaxID=57926 RepID=UPI0021765ED6|nr:uncharacterized protein LOC126785385 [Potentilla anserina]